MFAEVVNQSANERPPVDAGTTPGFAIESHWLGTTEADCWAETRAAVWG